jgi:predicted DNA-binding transcriptional regulator
MTDLEAHRKKLIKDEELRLRKEMMRRPKLLRELVLSKAQEKLFNFVAARYEVGAAAVAKEFHCSIQSASGRLSAMKKKGYLVRRKSIHGSGGLEYFYMTFSRAEYLESIPKQNRSLRC